MGDLRKLLGGWRNRVGTKLPGIMLTITRRIAPMRKSVFLLLPQQTLKASAATPTPTKATSALGISRCKHCAPKCQMPLSANWLPIRIFASSKLPTSRSKSMQVCWMLKLRSHVCALAMTVWKFCFQSLPWGNSTYIKIGNSLNMANIFKTSWAARKYENVYYRRELIFVENIC